VVGTTHNDSINYAKFLNYTADRFHSEVTNDVHISKLRNELSDRVVLLGIVGIDIDDRIRQLELHLGLESFGSNQRRPLQHDVDLHWRRQLLHL